MADLQISALPALGEAGIQATDVLALADLSATETKKVTVKDLVAAAVALLDSGDIPAAKVATPFATDAVATATIQNLAVTAGKIANGTITATQIANATITGAKLVDDTVTATQIAANAITASELADNAVDNAAIADLAVDNDKIANTTIAYAKLNLSDGDIPGAKIAAGGITSTQLATNSVTATELADNAVDANAIASGVITGAKIASNTIAAGNIVNNTITNAQIADLTIGTDQIANNAITTAKLSGTIEAGTLADGAVTTAKLDNDAVDSTKLAANAVDANALANNAVDSGAIASNAVIEAKIATDAVTNAKIKDGEITPAKLNSSNLDRSLNVASGNLGINNVITAATRSGISYNAQGLITGTVALAAADLPVATTSAVGGVSVGTGLAVNGAGALSLSNSVTGATVSGITFSNTGQITAATALVASDLPVSTTSAKGAVQITSGGGLTVDGSGNLTTSTSGISAGTYQSITVNNKGVATAGAALTAALVPDLAASKITSGSLDAARIANDSISGDKLSNDSVAVFQSIAQAGYPTAKFSGQILFDTVSEDAFIWDGNAWQAITTLTKGSLVFGGTYNASTSQMVATTSAGIAAGLAVGSNLPTPSATTDGVYVVVATSGTPASPAPAIAFAPPDYILGVTNSAGSSWNEVDLSQTVAGQVASNITFTPYGQISATNLQDALQELETEKLAKAGGTVTGQVLIGNTGSLVFEGSTVDAYETTLTVADPTTSDKTITLPNVTGTVITTGDTNTVNKDMVDGSLINTNIAANAAIAFTKLADLTSAQILVGNGSNEPTAVAVTGDISINNAGLTSIASGVIVDGDISGSAQITGSKVVTGTTSAVGVLQLTNAADSTSATTAATPAAVKTAKDAADAAQVTADAALPKDGSGAMTGNLTIDNAKELRLSEADSNGANYLGLKAPDSVTADITWTLPDGDGSANQFLKTDGSGNLSWGTDNATDATKMPLTGGSFTGDVIFDGATAGRDITFDRSANSLIFANEAKAQFGQTTLFHNSVDLYVQNAVGDIRLEVESGAPGLWMHRDGSIELYDGNAVGNPQKKLETTATGVTITGTATATTFSGSGASLTTLNASNLSSGTVAAARLGSGTTSSSTYLRGDNTWGSISQYSTPLTTQGDILFRDASGDQRLAAGTSGYFLKTQGSGADPVWSAVPAGVTINNNADNRVITGSGTANTLEGEANLTFDGTDLALTGGLTISHGSGSTPVPLIIDGSGAGNTKIELKGADEPRITYYENTTLKAYLIWNQTNGEFFTQNVEHSTILSVGATLRWSSNNGTSFSTVLDSSSSLNASNISSGTIAAARVPTLNQDTTGTAASVTGAAQSAITSLGTLTGLTVDGDLSIASSLVHTGDTDTKISFASNTIKFDTDTSERCRIDSSGRLLVGVTSSSSVYGLHHQLQVEGTNGATSSTSLTRNSNDANPPYLTFGKTRGTSDGSNTIVQDGDALGTISFNGADGTNKDHMAAQITGAIDGTPGENDLPGRLVFKTTADGANSSTERMRIGSAGQLGIAGANYGTSGQILTSGGASAAPSWQDAAGSVILIDGGNFDNGSSTVSSTQVFDGGDFGT